MRLSCQTRARKAQKPGTRPEPHGRALLLVTRYWLLGKTHPQAHFYIPLPVPAHKRRRRDSFSGLISSKIPQKVPVAADRAFLTGALSAKVTFAKARGCGHFSVRNREGRVKGCLCRSDSQPDADRYSLLVLRYWLLVTGCWGKSKTPAHSLMPLFAQRTSGGAGALFSGLISSRIPQKVPVAADRAFLTGALSAKVTFAKARGCGHFSVTNREGRVKGCLCRSDSRIDGNGYNQARKAGNAENARSTSPA